ncbi:Crp/Fnr family transcriptional regulator [Jannaschia sp. Os4]|uniref:Crp/Fnr family transcriptional regulator n=1 Tax=Jannaschia sp. Os4 TaxID=2807617 RepID=UPI001939DBB7|nr:Crp/Fnr family transcriptional regulator [Jannaschia sp. Os4]MBM2578155.1 Crp/Fnr family transcriptional regulator [Jannaschia sp. Os4]
MIRIMSDVWINAFAVASERVLCPGSALFHRGDPVRDLFLVREGRVILRRALEDGGSLDLHTAGPGDVVALASLFSETTHCDAICETEVRVASRPVGAIHAWLGASPAAAALAQAAREVQGLRARIEVMRLRRLSDRLDAYLDLHGAPDAGGWVGVADWIGVSSPALYRELGRRRGLG